MKSQLHKCPVTGCNVMVRSKVLMCAAHWALVPKGIKADIWLNFRSGHWKAYMEVRAKAIASVEREERIASAFGIQQSLL